MALIMLLTSILYATSLFRVGLLAKLEVQTGDHSSSAEAERQLQRIQKGAEHMQYGKCWTAALETLKTGCRRMNDETQRRIAYAFARCHLLASGREIPECPENEPFLQCTQSDTLSDLGYNTYTEFFTHSQQICFHLQSQAWHEATENTIDRLADNSHDVAVQLEQSSKVANRMIVQQNKSLQNQELLLERDERLRKSMQRSVFDVQKSHAETKKIINEQRALFHEVFDRVAVLQKTILGEFSSIYTFGFYVGSTILAYILTSTSYTNGARIWLFLLLIFNALTERAISNYQISKLDRDHRIGESGEIIPELIHNHVWLCRQIYCGLSLVVLIISVYRFKDYTKLNNSLLNEIKRQNQQLQDYIRENIETSQNFPNSPISARIVKPGDIEDENAGKLVLLEKMQHSINAFELSHDKTVVSVSDTTLRRPSICEDSNISFRPSEISESDASSVLSISTRSSVSTVRGNGNITRRSSTPLRDTMSSLNASQTTVKKVTRRSAVMAVLDESVTYIAPPSDSIVVGGYSLRRRPDSPRVNRNLRDQESVQEFTSYMLDGLAEQSAVRRNRIRQHLEDSHK